MKQSGTSSDHERHSLFLFASTSHVKRYNGKTTEFIGPDRGERVQKKECATREVTEVIWSIVKILGCYS